MKKMNHLKVFGIIVVIFMILITIGYTVQRDTATLPARVVKDGVSIVQRGYVNVVSNFKGVITNMNDLFQTHEENQRLRQQMFNYQALRAEMNQLEAENESLKTAIETLGAGETGETLTQFDTTIATTIGRDIDTWHDFLIINKGERQGVEVDMAVLSKEGYLIGRVTQVNEISSRIQLNNYQNVTSKVSAVISGKPESIGLLQGYDFSTGELVMINVDREIEVEEGDLVVTSGLGNIFPSGLLIGYVERSELSINGLTQTLYLSSGKDYNNLDFVILVNRKAVRAEND